MKRQEQNISVLIVLVSSEGSDETAHMRRLVRAFAAHTHTVEM